MKAISIQRMCAHAGSHKINEVKIGNWKKKKKTTNVTKKHLYGRAKRNILCLISVWYSAKILNMLLSVYYSLPCHLPPKK